MQIHAPLAPETIDARRRYLCRHIFTDGRRCASPALRGHDFCYYHRAARPPMPLASRTGIFTMPRIDDRAAIQIALFEVLSRISAGDIDLKRAHHILYGLQIASSNLARLAGAQTPAISPGAPLVEEIVRDFHLGDLAPILELPSADPALPPSPEPPSHAVIPSEGRGVPAVEAPPHLPSAEPPTDTGCPAHDATSAASWVGDDDTRNPSPAQARLPIPPELIASDAAERARIAQEIQSALQSAARILARQQTIHHCTSPEPEVPHLEPALPPSALAP